MLTLGLMTNDFFCSHFPQKAVLLGSLQAADETRPESEMVTAGRHSKVSYGCNASGPFGSPRPCFHRFSFGYPLGFCICDGGWVAFVKTVAWSTTSLNHLPKYKHAYVHRLSPSAWRIPPLIGKKFRIRSHLHPTPEWIAKAW